MPSYVAAILKIPEQLIEEQRNAGELIAVEDRRRLPLSSLSVHAGWNRDGALQGLGSDADPADWMRLEWLLVPDDALEGISPLEALRAGRLEDVLDIARDHEGQDPRRVLSTKETPGDITALLADDLADLDHEAPRQGEDGPRPLERPVGDPRNGVHFIMGSGLGSWSAWNRVKRYWTKSQSMTTRQTGQHPNSWLLTAWWRSSISPPRRSKVGEMSGKVIAFRKDAHGFVYPARQFDHSRPIEGLDRVAGYFPSPEEAWEWLVTPNQYTDSAAPIDRLRSGHIEEVVRAAEGANDYQ